MDSKDLLQVNATVITGLLILLTVQTFTGEIRPLQDANEWQNEATHLEVEQWALNKTLTELMNKTATNEIQVQTDELSTRLLEVTYKLEKMRNYQFKIIDENNKVISIEEELKKSSFLKIVQTYGIIMLVPFVASSMILMGIELEKEEKRLIKQKSLKLAKLLMLIGFGIILVSLVAFNYLIH